ncbi:MAG: cupin domain-containing protein [Bryobacteraceae bacterium]|jgi:quercetin dioxygenase-like cupin family protein
MQLFTWDEMEKEVVSETFARRFVHGEKTMLAQIFLKKGSVVPLHRHDSEQITHILEGALEFELEGERVVLHQGQVLVIPSNAPHSAVALEDTVNLEVFAPPRQDWIDKSDAYLRK